MEIENNLNNNITEEKDQKSFLETSIGKVVDSAIDVGLRMLLPDVIEDGIIEVKDSLLKEGLKEGERKKAIEIAKEMLAKKLDIDLIKEITKLSQEEIEKLISKK